MSTKPHSSDHTQNGKERIVATDIKGMGVGGRLLLAFFGISGFAILAAAAAMYAFWANRAAFDQVTEQRMPAALDALEISRQTERIVAAAPSLLTVRTSAQHADLSSRIQTEVESFDRLVEGLELRNSSATGVDNSQAYTRLVQTVSRMRNNLRSLDTLVEQRQKIAVQKTELVRSLIVTHFATDRLMAPWLQTTEASMIEAQREITDTGLPELQRSQAATDIASTVSTFKTLQEVQASTASINDMLLQAESMETYGKLQVVLFRLRRSLNTIRELNKELHPKLQPLLLQKINDYRDLALGDHGIPGVRKLELDLLNPAEQLISENAALSAALTSSVDALVDSAKQEINQARQHARFIQTVSISVLLTIVGLSLLSSVLIVWRYVSRNLVRRLRSLSESMLAIANGNLSVHIPSDGKDEIAKMAKALKVFQDTAIDVRKTNLQEIREARKRLSDAIESISEGFALFDADDRLIIRNRRFVELFPGLEEVVVEGIRFEDIIRSAEYRGLLSKDRDKAEIRITERLDRHNNPGAPFLQRYSNGHWIQISERETGSKGIVAVYTDVTDVKHHEEAARKARDEAENMLVELKKAQNSLVQAEKLAQLGQLVAGIAHELKNPLNFVSNFAEVSEELIGELQDLLYGSPAQITEQGSVEVTELLSSLVTNLRKIREHGLRADNIIKSMLAHSRGGARDWQKVDINKLVEESMNLAFHGARATDPAFNVVLESTLDKNANEIEVITQDISRVLLNLLSNSFDAVRLRQASEPDANFRPTVSVKIRDLGDKVKIQIKDNGTGINPEINEKIFTPFFTTKPAGKGTGLGLSLSYDIVTHEHGGQLEVASKQGEYTVFTITIPRITHHGNPESIMLSQPDDEESAIQSIPTMSQIVNI